MPNRKEWFAVIASLVLIGALVGLVVLTRPVVWGELLPLQLWYLHEGATLDWEVYREGYGGEPEEALVTHRVVEVANETVVLFRGRQGTGGQTLNETLSREYMEEYYSTLAAYITLQGLRIRNVTYRAVLMTYDVGEHSYAALDEAATYEDIRLGLVTTERVTDLTTHALLYSNYSQKVEWFDPPLWFNGTWRLTSFQGLELTLVERMDIFEMRLEDVPTLVYAFNAPSLSIDIQEGAVHVGLAASQEAMVASLIDRARVPVVGVALENASQSWLPINGTHSLLRVRTSPGAFQFSLTLGQEPMMTTGTIVIYPGRAGERPFPRYESGPHPPPPTPLPSPPASGS